MPELLAPGVFIQEVPFGPQPIEGVSTSTAGFVGETVRGPESGAHLVTDFPQFERLFGGYAPGLVLPHSVRGFFDNGGRRLYVARAIRPDATTAEETLPQDVRAARILSRAPISAAGEASIVLSEVVGLDIGDTLTITEAGTGHEFTANVVTVSASSGVVGVDTITAVAPAPAVPAFFDPRLHTVSWGSAPSPAVDVLRVLASSVGSWGNRLSVRLELAYQDWARVVAQSGSTVRLSAVGPFPVGAIAQLEAANNDSRTLVRVQAVNPVLRDVELHAAPTDSYVGGRLHRVVWRLRVWLDGEEVETLEGLPAVDATLAGTVTGAETELEALAEAIQERSRWVRVGAPTTASVGDLSVLDGVVPSFTNAGSAFLDGGTEGTSDPEIIGDPTAVPPTALAALATEERINILAAPGQTDEAIVAEMITQAELRQDRFVVFDSSAPDADVATVLTERGEYNSQYAAMYHPWLEVRDPRTRTRIVVPPSGHVVGCYARTDNDRGVWKAPANVTLRGVLGFSQVITRGQQEVLNPEGINALRDLDGLGNVIWGARTIGADTLWKYVSVRRLFIFIEQSIIRGTRWAVFEPNDTKLWKRIDDSVTNFLETVWRDGGLFGETAEQAFFVRVDETTTTQDDRDNGRVNIVVGIAPVKPAEFVVFRIGQAPTSVILEESA